MSWDDKLSRSDVRELIRDYLTDNPDEITSIVKSYLKAQLSVFISVRGDGTVISEVSLEGEVIASDTTTLPGSSEYP